MAVKVLKFDPDSANKIRLFARQSRVSLFAYFFSVLAVLFHIRTGRQKFGLGTYFSNRTHSDVENLIGDFATTYIVGVDVSPEIRFRELLLRVQHSILSCMHHAEVPRAALNWYRLAGRNAQDPDVAKHLIPEFEISVGAIQETEIESPKDFSVRRISFPLSRPPDGGQVILVRYLDSPDKLFVHAEYRSDLFDDMQMVSMLEHFQTIVMATAADGDIRPSGLHASVVHA
jgi:non-ribosomal peptide synthetase component F